MKRYSKYFLFFVLLALICAGCSNAADSPEQEPANESLKQAIEKIETASSDIYEIDVSVTGKLTRSDIFRLRGALRYNPTVYVDLDLSGAEFTTVPRNAFYVVSMLTNIALPDTVTVIEEGAFESAGLRSITLSKGLTAIKDKAFRSTYFPSIEIPEGVTSIGESSFSGSLKSVSLPSTLIEIGANAFSYTELTSIEIPANVTSIGYQAFYRISSLSSVTVRAETPPAAPLWGDSWDAFGYASPDLKIQVPAASVDAYQNADGWKEYAGIIIGIGT